MRNIRIERYIQPPNIIYLLFLLGFVGGMVIAFLSGTNGENTDLTWLDNILLYIKYGDVRYGNMLFYVIRQRVTLVFILLILCMSHKGKYILTGAVGLVGVFVGYFITEFIMAKGILGSLLFLTSIFPHGFLYGYAYYCFLMGLFHKNDVKTIINQYSQKTYASTNKRPTVFVKKMLPLVVVIIGVLLECYVNPIFLKLFLKIFM